MGVDATRLEAYKCTVNGVQMNLKLEVPELSPEDERLKTVMDIVVERFGGNLMAYYDAIRPKTRELTEGEERMSLLANQLAKRPSLPGLRFARAKPLNVKVVNEPFVALGNQEADTPRADFEMGQSHGQQV